MIVNTPAIVISVLKYGEADLIVKCYTQKSGLKTYMLRGILKSKKGKLKTSLFQPLTQLEIVANHKDKGTLEYLKEAKILHPYETLHINIVKSSMVMFLSEMLKNTIQEEEQNEGLYHYLEYSLTWMDTHSEIANFHLLFLLKLTRFLGFYPDDSSVEKPYFNMLDGVFQEINTNPYCVEGENVKLLSLFLNTDFKELTFIKLNKNFRKNFLEFLLSYFQIHLESFKKPRSLSVLSEIFH